MKLNSLPFLAQKIHYCLLTAKNLRVYLRIYCNNYKYLFKSFMASEDDIDIVLAKVFFVGLNHLKIFKQILMVPSHKVFLFHFILTYYYRGLTIYFLSYIHGRCLKPFELRESTLLNFAFYLLLTLINC